MSDVERVRRNIAKLINAGASEADIDAYVSEEGISIDDLHGKSQPERNHPSSKGLGVERNAAIDWLVDIPIKTFQGLTANYGDELVGKASRAGNWAINQFVPEDERVNLDQVENFARDAIRNSASRADYNSPIMGTAAEIGGAFLPFTGGPLKNMAARAATLPTAAGRIAGAAGIGAGVGAAQSSGAAEDGRRLDAAIEGAGTGALTGGAFQGVAEVAAPVLGRMVKGAYNKITGKNPTAPIVDSELPFQVPTTRGQMNRDVVQQQFEQSALEGGLGTKPQQLMQMRQNQQQAAMQNNIDGLMNKIGFDADMMARPADAGDIVAKSLKSASEELKGKIDDAYEAARAAGRKASVPADDVTGVLAKSLKGTLSEQAYDPKRIPGVFYQVKRLEQLSDAFKGKAGGKVTGVKLSALENVRKGLQNLARSNDMVEAGAAKYAIRAYDNWLGDVMERAAIIGDDQAISAFKNARRLRAEMGWRFESNNVVKKIIDEELTAEQAFNKIIGGGNFVPQAEAGKTIKAIENAVGRDSDGFQALRRSALWRVFDDATQGTLPNGSPRLNMQKLASNVETMLSKNKSALDALYSPEEVKYFSEIGKVARRIGEIQPGAANPSGTANRLLAAMRRSNIPFADEVGNWMSSVANTRKVKESLGMALPPPRNVAANPKTVILSGAAGGVVGKNINNQ
ncbi:hypothetical protein UFOVP413_31 [uncultured Caudovirales phage]|uniref:Uncharacterized protein n=1 Tax=uncultured Caudovirales phage TaxID=2100421 RepID=A0A6J5M4C9_9CAUD|nr:hypothetical protein UFOVP413_31 [uncultured Caudovirales phage]